MEIEEFLKTDEAKAVIASAVEEATKPLVSKRDELLGKLKKANDERTEAQKIADEAAAEKARIEEEAVLKSGDIDKIKQQLETKHTKEMQDRDASIADKDAKLHKLLVDNALSNELTKAGIAPQYMDAVKALIKSNNKSEITEVDGNSVALIDGKSINEFVSEFSQGEQGKHYVAAPNNGGGGANGSNGSGKATGAGNMGGDKSERVAAINSKYPELN